MENKKAVKIFEKWARNLENEPCLDYDISSDVAAEYESIFTKISIFHNLQEVIIETESDTTTTTINLTKLINWIRANIPELLAES